MRGLLTAGFLVLVIICYLVGFHSDTSSAKGHKYEKVKKSKTKNKNLSKNSEILENNPELAEAVKKINAITLEREAEKLKEYRKDLPPDSDYLKPVLDRPSYGMIESFIYWYLRFKSNVGLITSSHISHVR